MISAGTGKEVANAIRQELRDNLCGEGWVNAQGNDATKEFVANMGVVDETCQASFDEAWEKNTNGLNDTQLEFFAANAAYYVSAQLNDLCQLDPTFAYQPTGDQIPNTIFAKSMCLSNYINPDRLPFSGEVEGIGATTLPEGPTDLNYHGERYDFGQLLAHIKLSTVGMHQGTSEGIDMPQSLKDFIENLKKAGLPEHAALAEKLFYQGIGLVKPSGEMALAAQPIADHVQKYVKEKAHEPYKAYMEASEEEMPGVADANKAKKFPELEYTFVASTAPKKDNYKVDIKEAPKAIKDYFKDFPPPIRREALRLYGEALEKAGKGASDDAVAKLLVKKIKEKDKKHGGDKAKLADELMRLKVDQVKLPNTMIFKEITSPNAPYELLERAGWEGSHAKVYAINRIWRDVVEKVGKDKMDLKLMGKIVDDLAPQLKGKDIKDLAAQKVVSVNKKSGKVTLLQYPKEIQDTLFHTANAVNNNLPPNMAQHGASVYHKVVEIYEAAKKAKPSMNDKVVAAKVEDVADKALNPFLNNDPYHPDPVGKFLLSEFSHFDKDGNIVLKQKYGTVEGKPDGRFEHDINEDLKFIYNVKGEGAIGSVIGVGDNDPGFIGMALVNTMIGFHSEKAGNFKLKFGIEGFAQNEIFAQGEPRGEFNWDYNGTMNSPDDVYLLRLGHAVFQWDKEIEGEKVDVTPEIGIGLHSTRPKFGSDYGMNWDKTPIASFQPLVVDSSRSFGLSAALALGFKPGHVLKFGGILTNPVAAVQYDSEGGQWTAWESGVKGGGFVESDFELVNNDKAEWHLKLRAEGQGSSTGQWVAGGGLSSHVLIDNHYNVGLGLGGGYKGADGPDYRYFGAGGYFSYQTELGDSNVTMEVGLAGAGRRLWTKDLVLALDPLTSGETGDPDCDIYECPDDHGADVGEDGSGNVSGTGDLPNTVEGGLVTVEGHPFIKFLFGESGLYADVGVSILYVHDIVTKKGDWVGIPMLRVGGTWGE